MKVEEILTEEKQEDDIPVPKGFARDPVNKWYPNLMNFTATRKGDRLVSLISFYEKLGWKITETLAPGETMKNWGATVAKMKSPTPGLRAELVFDHHRNEMAIQFFKRKVKSKKEL